MLIQALGGEFELIRKLLPKSGSGGAILLPNGDDAAVVRSGPGALVATVDSIVEGTHFSLEYFTPRQIGIRAIEGAVSDVAAVGGSPRYVLCALVLPKRSDDRLVRGIYSGIRTALRRVGAVLIGGDTSSSSGPLSISVTVLGEIPQKGKVLRRAGAKPGDLVMVSGGLGGSAAGLEILKRGIRGHAGVTRCHLEPRCRVDIAPLVARFATSGIDISDGLSSEIHHLCRASGCGAVIDLERIPARRGVREAAQAVRLPADRFLLDGGEEYELLYTVDPRLRRKIPGSVIGEITRRKKVVLRSKSGVAPLPPGGFVHLS